MARRCCCWKMATACATRRWMFAPRAQLHEKQDFRATSLETLRQMVASGGGITLLPLLASSGAYGNTRGVATLPFAKPGACRVILARSGARPRRAARPSRRSARSLRRLAGKQVEA